MRLIDADKITITRYDYEGALTLKQRLQRLVDNQATVEAIPIEFLDKWFGNNYNAFTALMMAWNIEKAKIKLYEYPNKIYSREEVCKPLPEIEEMVRDGEKENEID